MTNTKTCPISRPVSGEYRVCRFEQWMRGLNYVHSECGGGCALRSERKAFRIADPVPRESKIRAITSSSIALAVA